MIIKNKGDHYSNSSRRDDDDEKNIIEAKWNNLSNLKIIFSSFEFSQSGWRIHVTTTGEVISQINIMRL